jgi:predicted PurR-regulated permease PerM
MPEGETTVSARGRSRPIHPVVDRLAGYSWRLIVIGIVGLAILALLERLRVVLFPVAIATFLTVLLAPAARWLRRHGVPHLLSTWTVFFGFIGLLVLVGALIVPAMTHEFEELGPTITTAVDDIEEWLVNDSPFDISQKQIDDFREQLNDRAGDAISSNAGVAVRSAVLVVELVAGLVLTLVLTFFFVKDGEKFQRFALRRIPPERHALARRLANRGWAALAGYLRGSAMLGIIEAIVIGIALALVGGGLVAPVMVITFAAAFIPLVGAVVAGVIAVLIALVTAGFAPALIVLVVAVIVQQFDNDLLAPFVFGKTLELHPVIILLAVTAGGTLFGLAGAFLAVPVTAVIINVTTEAQIARGEDPVEVEEGLVADDSATKEVSS